MFSVEFVHECIHDASVKTSSKKGDSFSCAQPARSTQYPSENIHSLNLACRQMCLRVALPAGHNQAVPTSVAVESSCPITHLFKHAQLKVTSFPVQEVCLHAALAAGHDQAVLQAALQRLQQPQVARLIAYLLKWVTRHTGKNSTPSPPSRQAKSPA